MRYKVVFIDWDGTLSNSKFWERWKSDPQHSELYHQVQNALFESAEGEALIVDWMLGRSSYKVVLEYVSSLTNIPLAAIKKELRYSAEKMKFIEDNAPKIIQDLRAQGTKVVIATDNMDTFRRWTVPALGLEDMFDEILSSYELGTLKSHIDGEGKSTFFARYLLKHGINANEAVLIDNSLNNVVVERCGIEFLHVNDAVSATEHLQEILNQ